MKLNRTLILTTVLVVALFAAVIPALAIDPGTLLNDSFMGDQNNDNIPDKWNIKGDVFRTCSHPFYPSSTNDPCMMVFPPSTETAALWQHAPVETTFLIVEEGVPSEIGRAWMGAKQLDAYRGYYGLRLKLHDDTMVTLYEEIPNGTYPFGHHEFMDNLGSWAKTSFSVPEATYGILMFPGDGYLGIDVLRLPTT